jgi:hypothetical protein
MQKSAVSLIASRRNCKSEVSAFTYTLLSEFCGQNQATSDYTVSITDIHLLKLAPVMHRDCTLHKFDDSLRVLSK